MFSILKKKNPYQEAAQRAYGQLLQKSREPVFYTEYKVPDSFDGRFDLLLFHIFLLVNRLTDEGKPGQDFNQALFDQTFADMDQTLREMGIGDMGVPKHMRRMMKAFNGRMHGYDEALKQGDGALAIALRRNLYGTLEDEEVPNVQKIIRYMKGAMQILASRPVSELIAGEVPIGALE
jgi:cytochrome b pre-mRNA-processing protein 3